MTIEISTWVGKGVLVEGEFTWGSWEGTEQGLLNTEQHILEYLQEHPNTAKVFVDSDNNISGEKLNSIDKAELSKALMELVAEGKVEVAANEDGELLFSTVPSVGNADYICVVCAEKMGCTWPEGLCATFHMGNCDVCGKEMSLCSVGDYDWPDGKRRGMRD